MSNPQQSFPPLRLGPSRPLSPSTAQNLLATYIASAASNPYMLPNAKLLASGPAYQGAADGGLTMHNMKRVEAGLRGEFLAPRLDLEEEGTGEGGGENGKVEEVMEGVEYQVDGGDANGVKGKSHKSKKSKSKNSEPNTDDMWASAQPIDSYQREQSIEAGEVGSHQAGDVVSNQLPKVTSTTTSSSQLKEGAPSGKMDKEARKAAKRARRKEENKAKMTRGETD